MKTPNVSAWCKRFARWQTQSLDRTAKGKNRRTGRLVA